MVWGRRALLPFDQIFENAVYMFKIFYMVALGSYVTFSPNLSKFSGERRGVTFLTNLSGMFSPFYEGGCKICQLRMMKTLTNQN